MLGFLQRLTYARTVAADPQMPSTVVSSSLPFVFPTPAVRILLCLQFPFPVAGILFPVPRPQ